MGHIDAHSHVWADDLAAYPISPPYTPADMQPATFTPDDLLALAEPCGVDRVVLIQMSFYEFDNSYMLDCIARYPGKFSGVAIVDHTREDLGDEMARLRAGGARGFRVYQCDPFPHSTLDQGPYDRLLGLAGELDMAICPLLDPSFLPVVGKVAQAFPRTTFVLDHLARVGIGGQMDETKIDALCALGRHDNCYVKVSGFYALGTGKAPHDDLIPLIRRVHDAFGARRLIWATDCPYQAITSTYEASIGLIRDRIDFLSDEDKREMLGGTAERVFFCD
jgi:predicted TIM-barrel fold metal-dependent hydrolase